MRNDRTWQRDVCIEEETHYEVLNLFFYNGLIVKRELPYLQALSNEEFFRGLKFSLPADECRGDIDPVNTLQRAVAEAGFQFDVMVSRSLLVNLNGFNKLLREHLAEVLEAHQVSQKDFCNMVMKAFKEEKGLNQATASFRDTLWSNWKRKPLLVWDELSLRLYQEAELLLQSMLRVSLSTTLDVVSLLSRGSGSTKSRGTPDNAPNPIAKRNKVEATNVADSAKQVFCNICGRNQPPGAMCWLRNHPDRNQISLPWSESPKGKEWLVAGKRTCATNCLLSGKVWVDPNPPKGSPQERARGSHKAPPAFKKGKDTCAACVVKTDPIAAAMNPVSCIIHAPHVSFVCRALMDSGSTRHNFIGEETLHKLGRVRVKDEREFKLCGVLDDLCVLIKQSVILNITLISPVTHMQHTLSIKTYILPSRRHELIIGLPAMKQHDLFSKMFSAGMFCLPTTPTSKVVNVAAILP